ncbi:MAG: homocysteine S-methyltransferase family protein [Clostridia bacterium]|nr:homocysteine S-methyltransferase family protein [Clostridia bacterium]
MKKRFLDRLGRERLYWDGGTGSLLQARGLKGGELPERWNLTHPDAVLDVALSYFRAGANIVNSNTFGANRLHYPDADELKAIVEAGVARVIEARRLCGREDDAYVALDIGPTGRLLKPMGDLDFEAAVALFGELARWGEAAGADLILIETMNDTMELKAAVLAAKENSRLPVCATCVFDEKGKLLTGGTPESLVALLEGLRVDALGVNCGLGPVQMLPIVQRLLAASSLPVIVNPNAGLPRMEGGRTVYDLSAGDFSDAMVEIAKLGAHVLGGCCGTTPEYIRQEIEKTRSLPFAPPTPKRHTVVSSFSQVVEIGPKPVIVGERINPTGKKKLQQALRDHDLDAIVAQGLSQEESGAQVLDVNVGLPGIDEPAMMAELVPKLQSVLALPLQIDSSSPEALERGLRLYNGKPLINSVNGKRENLDAVLPLAAKYGGVLIALPLDEHGIPDTAEGRVAIARRIVGEAARHGIAREDIVVDGLAMTISADATSARTTLETLRRVRDELGLNTVLGVSNISFGLPQREVINAYFFTMAMESGLSLAIINPGSAAMMAAWRSWLALNGLDPQCAGFISAYGQLSGGLFAGGDAVRTAAAPAATSEHSLAECVRFGMAERAAQQARAALEAGQDPMAVINDTLIPALDAVGRGFEAGTLFLPQLLMSADAAKAAFATVKEALSGAPQAVKGELILATVKGDIHDIGKNIVKVLLENYGYRVIDLGKDVPPEAIVEAAKKGGVRLVGLSALMTTTVSSMEETIRLLRAECPGTKVVVGGAVLTASYAAQIGADRYAREAMDTVRYADEVFSGSLQE